MSCVLYTSVQGTHNRTLIPLTSIHVLWKVRGEGRGDRGDRREEKESGEEERNDGGKITITTVLAISGFQ